MSVQSKAPGIAKYRKKHPCATGPEIADKFDVTRQYVSSVLKRKGLCGHSAGRGQVHKCAGCGKPIHRASTLCKDCYRERHHVTVVCAGCGKLFDRTQSALLHSAKKGSKNFYCGRPCRARSLGSEAGFARHPENIRKGSRG